MNRHLACDLIVIIRCESNEMANYKPDLSSQNKCIPMDLSQQMMPGTFEYSLVHIVDNHLGLWGLVNGMTTIRKELQLILRQRC
jgi:hypothetical protein